VPAADLTTLYYRVGRALEVPEARRNLEGACVVGDDLRWFQRGHRRRGLVDASVDVDLTALVGAIAGDADPAAIPFSDVRRYDLSALTGLGWPAVGCRWGSPTPWPSTAGACWSPRSPRTPTTPSRTARCPPRRSRCSTARRFIAWTPLPADASGAVP
jgi:hypothetical protein